MLLPAKRRGKVLRELLEAMQIDNVLDGAANSCTLNPHTNPQIVAAIRACSAFRNPEDIEKTEQLFGMDRSASGFKTVGYIAKRIAALFKSAGLDEVVPGKKKQVKKVEFTPYTLHFNTRKTRQTSQHNTQGDTSAWYVMVTHTAVANS
jgi:hypothetical protein